MINNTEVLNILSQDGNANQNYVEISASTTQNSEDHYENTAQVGKENSSYLLVGILQCCQYGNNWGSSLEVGSIYLMTQLCNSWT